MYRAKIQKDNCSFSLLKAGSRATASKSEDFLEVVGLQTTFPSARLEGELVVLLAKDG